MPMLILSRERSIPLRDIIDAKVVDLLESSAGVHSAFHIDMNRARWLPDRSRLILDMEIAPEAQGWSGIIHGGITDFLLHDLTGIAALIHARERNQVVLGSKFAAKYCRPLPLGTSVEVEATIGEKNQGDFIYCQGEIRDDQSTPQAKTYAEGLLRVKAVSEIRRAK